MLKVTTVIAVVFSLVACEDDFETIGTGVIGEPNFNANLYDEADISVTNIDLGPVQTNNLPLFLLGTYEDQVFGKQEASILSQVYLSQTNPNFGNEPVVDSVVLSIPYFSTEISTEEGEKGYRLDSIYGNSPIKLSVLATNFFLNDYDPATNFEKSQKYYSNLSSQVLDNGVTTLYETNNFKPSAQELVLINEKAIASEDTVRLPPQLRVKLSTNFFQSKIIDAEGSLELSSQKNFTEYLRSIYIRAEKISENGSMMLLNLNQAEAGIIIYYTIKVADTSDSDDDGDTSEMVEVLKSFKLNFGQNRVNTFEQEVPSFNEADKVYLKGGEGSMAVIELFSGPDSE